MNLGRLAREALEEEVRVTPKPGLVDRANSGAHTDMDITTFLSSAESLEPYFAEAASRGAEASLPGCGPGDLFRRIRPLGLRAEEAMFRVTRGVNTHKGLIFSLGILCASAGRLVSTGLPRPASSFSEAVCLYAAEMTQGLVVNDLEAVCNPRSTGRPSPGPATKGARLYKKHGIRGVRGETEAGFPSVRTIGLPRLAALTLRSPFPRNEVLVAVLLHLMAEVEDTNVLGRHGFEALAHVRSSAKKALDLDAPFSPEGLLFLEAMDRDFIARHISPGGSADLLAVTVFLERVEKAYSSGLFKP